VSTRHPRIHRRTIAGAIVLWAVAFLAALWLALLNFGADLAALAIGVAAATVITATVFGGWIASRSTHWIRGRRQAVAVAIGVLVGEFLFAASVLASKEWSGSLPVLLLIGAGALSALGIGLWSGSRLARRLAALVGLGLVLLVVFLAGLGMVGVACSPYPQCAELAPSSPVPWWAVLVPTGVLLAGLMAPESPAASEKDPGSQWQ
jgi:hypothetical protein